MKPTKQPAQPYQFQQLDVEIINHVQEPNQYYDFQTIDQIVQSQIIPEDVSYYSASADLSESLTSFSQSGNARAAIALHIPLEQGGRPNHFTALYIERTENGYQAYYIDPTGLNTMPADVANAITAILGVQSENIVKTTNVMQHHTDGEIMAVTNVHCGAFVSYILTNLANGILRIENNRLVNHQSGDLHDLTEEASNVFGESLRNIHLQIIRPDAQRALLPENPIAPQRPIPLQGPFEMQNHGISTDHLTGWTYEQKQLYVEYRKAARATREKENTTPKQEKYKTTPPEKVFKENKKKQKEEGIIDDDLREKTKDFTIITINNDGTVSRELSFGEKKGLDENFRTGEAAYWRRIDDEMRLNEEDENFATCFIYSRLGTHEFLHALGEDGTVNGENLILAGHYGGLYKSYSLNTSSKNTKYSGESSNEGFHPDRQRVIEGVVRDPRIVAKEKPRKATIEALKFVVRSTIGLKDKDRRDFEFKGITSFGLDLSRLNEREYALKYFQAVRNKYKIVILKLIGQDHLRIDTDLANMNSALETQGLSPISSSRTNSPYSRANLDEISDRLTGEHPFKRVIATTTKLTPPIVTKDMYDAAKAKHIEASGGVKEVRKPKLENINECLTPRRTTANLSGFDFGARNLQDLGRSPALSTLTNLNISNSPEGKQSTNAIAKIISATTNLTKLDLSGAKLTDKNKAKVTDALKKSKKLTIIEGLDELGIDEEAKKEITDNLEKNKKKANGDGKTPSPKTKKLSAKAVQKASKSKQSQSSSSRGK